MAISREMVKNLRRMRRMNHSLLFLALFLVVLSLTAVYTTTSHRTMDFFYKEIMFTGLGICVYFFFSFIDYRKYGKYYKLVYAVNVMMLLAVYVVGTKRLGAQRWIPLGPITIQPSEFAKILIVLTFSEVLATKYRERLRGMKPLFMAGLHILPIFLLIAKQPDLGTSLVLLFLYGVLVFLHGLDWKSIIISGLGIVISVPLAYFFLLKDYQKQRVLTFLNPEADLLGSGWNVTQSMIAIGSGGIFGKGFLGSTQSKLRFLPESHTDFIASVFLEERGLIGGVLLLFTYLILILQIINCGEKADEYGRLICYGIAAIIFFHVLVNLGMIMGVMPVTGLPLLLMSYGGSSYIFSFMMLGIAQSVKIYRTEVK
jgi:rod shape determining protein RodA